MRYSYYSLLTGVLVAGLSLAVLGGCRRDVRLAGKRLRTPTVGTVTHYGMTLDKDASPQEVAFVALRTIREDFEAPDRSAREAALDKQFDICAAGSLRAANRTSLSGDEFLYNVVFRWTPTVSHYVKSFDTEWEKASLRLKRRDLIAGQSAASNEVQQCEVLMEVDDPSGDPNARVVLVVWMVRDGGYWRVTHLGFKPGFRSISALSAQASAARGAATGG